MVYRADANTDHPFDGSQGEKVVQQVLLFLSLTRQKLPWDIAREFLPSTGDKSIQQFQTQGC